MKHLSNFFATQLFATVVLLFSSMLLTAQTGIIAGKIIEAKSADPLIGVSIRLDEGIGGVITDFDGNFRITNVSAGKHKISVNYSGYAGKTIEDIEVRAGEATTIDIFMEESLRKELQEIVTKAKKESASALTIFQKNSVSMADGIRAETIKRSPDRTVGDVIRRVSGATIQDNKFAIIRGLTDRYNLAILNGALLSSIEPDRKAFFFDLFPSSMLDNLVIVKTASADLPGEFAGGGILITTKDIPQASFLHAFVSGGINSVTTFKPFLAVKGGSTDWLGHDDGTRALPSAFPGTADFKAQTKAERYKTSQLFGNDWAIREGSSAPPNIGVQLSGGYVKDISEKVQFGMTLGGSYSNNNRLQNGIRADYVLASPLINFNDKQFKNNVLWGTLFNSALKINNKQKIGLEATYSTNADNIINDRSGDDLEQQRKIRSAAIEYTENHLLTTRLYGEHQLTEKGMRLNWGGGMNRTTRNVPSLRRMFYFKNFEDTSDVNIAYQAYVPFGSADPYRSGRFYSNLEEDTYNGNIDLSIPFSIGKQKQSIKIGGLYQKRDRTFDARVMGYVLGNFIKFDYSLLNLPQGEIFTQDHIGETGFIMDEITNPSDGYTGQSTLAAGYAMFDNKIADKLRISWGARVEKFRQQVQATQFGGTPLTVDRTITALLPSFNLMYSLTSKQQLRLAASKTVCRAEFRELAPFYFFDFYLNSGIVGNPSLTQGSIYNADIRYEVYPGQNQLFSVSLFYKRFNNPIEFTFVTQGAGIRYSSFNNVDDAKNYGVEMELRKHFGFVGMKDLVFFTNAALIRSNVFLSKGVSYNDSTRALQGQSPYIFNAGLTYNITKFGLSTTLIYNVIGDRVAQVGTVGYGDIYERRRHLVDFSLSKKLGSKGEVKLIWGDILRPEFMYYQDNNSSHKYEADKDNVMQRLTLGSTISLSLGCKF
jgi:outer membrane receptor protein involved in Fe transport